MRAAEFPFLPKDFIETASGLIFAVVQYHVAMVDNIPSVGCFLRYVRAGTGWKKVNTASANALLTAEFPEYLYYSEAIAAHYHAVPIVDIVQHHQPEAVLQARRMRRDNSPHATTLRQLIILLERYGANSLYFGLTGSMLIEQESATSDVDLAVYGRENFQQTRRAVQAALVTGDLQPLDAAAMRENYDRRAGALDYESFSWHDSRKYNKAVINGIKFDIGMVCFKDEVMADLTAYQKHEKRTFQTRIMDAVLGFDYPARYQIADRETPEVLVFTHSYVGQAEKGELVEISGVVERNAQGHSRLVIGSSREAAGEYIKVIK